MKLFFIRNYLSFLLLNSVICIAIPIPATLAQGLRNSGANIIVTSGAWVYVDGNGNGNYYTSANGELDVQSGGNFLLEGNWINNNGADNAITNTGTTGWVRFEGNTAGAQTVRGSTQTTFAYLEFNNSNGVTLDTNAVAAGKLELTNGAVTTGGNRLEMTSATAADLVTFGSAAFVNGNFRRYIGNNLSTYSFPVGNGPASSNYYLAELINGNLTGAGFNYIDAKFDALSNHNDADLVASEEGTAYISVSTEGVWFLDPDGNPTGGDYDLKLYIANIAGLADDKFSVLSRPSGSLTAADWACTPCGFGDPGINNNGGLGRKVVDGYALRMGLTGFSQKGIGKAEFPLPIQLLHLSAVCNDNRVTLAWSTASEKNNDFFTIEKSHNGKDFDMLIEVPGAGNSSQILDYEITDEQPGAATVYYRLKQTDYDGSFTYSDIVATGCRDKGMAFGVTPNPATDRLHVIISGMKPETGRLVILDAVGRMAYQKDFTGGFNRFTLDVSGFSPGLYLVALHTPGAVHKRAFIKE